MEVFTEDEDAALLKARLAQPVDGDLSLEDFAAEIGVDLTRIRADVAAGTPRAKYERG